MLQGAHNIVPLREFIVDLTKMSLRKTHRTSSLDDYKSSVNARFAEEGFEAEQVNTKTLDIIAASIFARREEMRKILTAKMLEQSADKSLIDYNYNVELVMSSSSSQSVMQPLLVVELHLKVN